MEGSIWATGLIALNDYRSDLIKRIESLKDYPEAQNAVNQCEELLIDINLCIDFAREMLKEYSRGMEE